MKIKTDIRVVAVPPSQSCPNCGERQWVQLWGTLYGCNACGTKVEVKIK